jgi:hypothetical protein
VNVSAAGALLDTARRLAPGGTVDLQWEEPGGRQLARGQVLRCEVVVVRCDAMLYRAAVRFERLLPRVAMDEGG